MQAAMATPYESLPAALLQHSANQRECGLRCIAEIIDAAFRKAGCGQECRGIALDNWQDRLDPGLSQRERRNEVGGRHRIRNTINEIGIEWTGFCQLINGLALVTAGPFEGAFPAVPASPDRQRSVGSCVAA